MLVITQTPKTPRLYGSKISLERLFRRCNTNDRSHPFVLLTIQRDEHCVKSIVNHYADRDNGVRWGYRRISDDIAALVLVFLRANSCPSRINSFQLSSALACISCINIGMVVSTGPICATGSPRWVMT